MYENKDNIKELDTRVCDTVDLEDITEEGRENTEK